jgi:hypothetical protein
MSDSSIPCCYCGKTNLEYQGYYSSRTYRSTGHYYGCPDCKKLVAIPYESKVSVPMMEGYRRRQEKPKEVS